MVRRGQMHVWGDGVADSQAGPSVQQVSRGVTRNSVHVCYDCREYGFSGSGRF